MSEIKFRAWDKINNKIYDDTFGITECGDVIIIDQKTVFSQPDYIFTDNLILMQYTGLKDRKNTDIYTGDILELINEDLERIKVVCKFGNRRMTTNRGNTIDVQCVYFETEYGSKTNPVVCNYKGLHDLEIMEVRGNIYENPELLEVQI